MKILYFAQLRELISKDKDEFQLSLNSVAELIVQVRERYPHIGDLKIFAAVNQVCATPVTVLQATDEVALFPQVTGG